MTLKIATVPELRFEATRALALLREAGILAETAEPDDGAPAGDGPVADVRAGRAAGGLVPFRSLAPGDAVAAVLMRQDPADVLLSRDPTSATLRTLPAGSRVGVAGRRRRAFLRAHRADLEPVSMENGYTPAEAYRSGRTDVAILSAAEAHRAGLDGAITEVLDAKGWLPGPQQGAVALVMGPGVDGGAASALEHPPTRAAVVCEGAVADLLDAWEAPLGVVAMPSGPWIRLWAMLVSPDGRRVVRGDLTGRVDEPEALAELMADYLRARGAAEVMAR